MSELDHVATIAAAWESDLLSARREPSGPRDYVYASARRDCVRRMALDLLHPEDEPPFPVEAMERIRRGLQRETDVVSILMRAGKRADPPFSVIEQQLRYEIKDRDGLLIIVGKVDGRIRFSDRTRAVFEVKSGDSVRNADTLEDLDRSPWTKHHVDQLLAYLLADNEEWGLLILDQPDGPVFLRVDLLDHLERAESFLRDARAAVDARFGRAPLPAYTTDASVCRRCPHLGKSCSPPLDYGAGAQVLVDPDLIALAEVCEANREARDAYEAADKRLKDALRGVELGILGDYSVTGTWQGAKKYEVPPEVKAQYETFDPRARFMLSLERVR